MATDMNQEFLGMKNTVFGLLKTVQKNVTELNTITGTLGSLMGRTRRLRAARAMRSPTRRSAVVTKPAPADINKAAATDGNKNLVTTGPEGTDASAEARAAEMKRMTQQMNEWLRKMEEETKRLETENQLMSQQLSKIAVQS